MTQTDSHSTTTGASSQPSTPRVETRQDEVIVHLPSPGRVLRTFLPEEAASHFENAARENLLGMRALLDTVISSLDERPTGAGSSAPARRINIPLE